MSAPDDQPPSTDSSGETDLIEAARRAAAQPPEPAEGLPDATLTHLMAAHTALAPGIAIGPYRILSTLGEGGFGVVYLAEQREPLQRRVALKVIKPGMDSRAVIARFEQERQALAVMDHPNVARVLDAGATDRGLPYFVMEYVKGEAITAYCDRHTLSIRARLELLVHVCDAVQHAHMKGIIHRDLKPSNILVSVGDQGPLVKVIDFGVAKALNQTLTQKTIFTERGLLIGTPEYMSPEQAEMGATDIDTRTDVYALGVILYELLTGALPFDPMALRSAGFAEIQRIIREVDPPKPSTRLSRLTDQNPPREWGAFGQNPPRQVGGRSAVDVGTTDPLGLATAIARNRRTDLPSLTRELRRELDWIPLKAMRKDRTERYRTPTDLADDIRNYLEGRPLEAGPESAAYRLRKFVRRHRGPVLAAAVILVLMLGASTVSTALYLRAEEQRRLAQAAQVSERQQRQEAEKQRALAEEGRREAEWQAYIANIVAADSKLLAGEIASARRRLDAAPLPFRNWEWQHLMTQSDGSLGTLRGHENWVNAVAFSPDGMRIASASIDRKVKLWEAASGAELATLWGHDAEVLRVAFSPNGTRLASGSSDATVRIWDAASGAAVAVLRVNPLTDAAFSVAFAFSPDGTRLASNSWKPQANAKLWNVASGSEVATLRGDFAAFTPDGTRLVTRDDKTLTLLDASSGEELATLRGHEPVALSPDGMRLASSSEDKTVKLWDVSTGAELGTLRGHESIVQSLAFSPDGARLASGSGDGAVKLWDVATGGEVATLRGHEKWVVSVAFSPDGTRLASASRDNIVKLWGVGDGAELATLRGHFAAFAPDGTRLVTIDDKTLTLLDAASGAEMATLRGHQQQVTSVAFSPDGRRIASGSHDSTLKLWDAKCGAESLILRGHEVQVLEDVAFSPDGTRLASGVADSTVKLWDASSGMELATLRGHEQYVKSVAFSPDGTRLASGSLDRTIKVWDTASGVEVATLRGHELQVWCVAFSSDGTRLASGSNDKTVKLWNVARGVELTTLHGHDQWVQTVAFSPDGTRLASGSGGGTVKLWDVASGKELATLRGHEQVISSLAFSPDGRYLASGSYETVKLWDADSKAELATLRGHERWVQSLAYSPDGTRLASGSADRTVKLWDVKMGVEVGTLRGHAAGVRSVAFSADGTRVASISEDKTVRVWDSLSRSMRSAMPAQPMVDALFEQLGMPARVVEHLRRDASLSPDIRKAADFAVLRRTSEMSAEAAPLVDRLFAEYKLAADVTARLRSDSTLGAALREFAIELVQRRGEDPFLLNYASWFAVKAAGKDALTYGQALRWAVTACRVVPENGYYLDTLGVAQYRVGEYERSLATLTRSDELNRRPDAPHNQTRWIVWASHPTPNTDTGHPVDAAFIAMSLHQLGREDEARAALERLRKLMQQPQWSGDEESQGFLREAEALFTEQAETSESRP